MAASADVISSAMIGHGTATADWLIIAPVATAITAGALLTMIRHSIVWHVAIAAVALGLMAMADAALLARVLSDGPVSMTMSRWLPPFGISFTIDALGAGFALVATVVALVCALAAARDIDASGRRYGFYPFLMLMMAGVSGAFLTGDIFNLYVWFEVFLISSFGLLVLGSRTEQIDGAAKYAVLNLIATALFLVATAYLYGVLGTLNMADIVRKAAVAGPTAPMMTIAALYLFAFGMKAAAFPVNFWLPASYHTPRMVTAALFGGLLTKIGVYALLRTMVMLFPAERAVLSGVIGWIAAATMILGALGALAQSDIRRLLGFLVISGVGVMMAGLAVAGTAAVAGTIAYAVHSMLTLSAFYLLVGLMRRRGGSYSLHELAGLYRSDPVMTAAALLLVLACAGLPPGSGLWPKIMLTQASIASGNPMLATAVLTSSLITIIALGRVFSLAFWRNAEARATSGGSGSGLWPIALLTAASVAIGLYPEPIVAAALRAAAGLIEPTAYVHAVFPEAGG